MNPLKSLRQRYVELSEPYRLLLQLKAVTGGFSRSLLPECLRERMTQAAIAVVEDPFEIRLERLNEEYFLRMHHDFTHAYGDEQGWQEYCEYLHHGLSAIKRRLGLQRYNELAARLDAALTTQLTTGSTDGHLAWLVPLLEEYYDPMYRYQLEKKAEKVVFRGEWAEVAEWVKAR